MVQSESLNRYRSKILLFLPQVGDVVLGETEECEDNRKNFLQSFEERRWRTVFSQPHLQQQTPEIIRIKVPLVLCTLNTVKDECWSQWEIYCVSSFGRQKYHCYIVIEWLISYICVEHNKILSFTFCMSSTQRVSSHSSTQVWESSFSEKPTVCLHELTW